MRETEEDLVLLSGSLSKWISEKNEFRLGLFQPQKTHETVFVKGFGIQEIPFHIPVDLYGKWEEYQNRKTGQTNMSFRVMTYIFQEPTSPKELEALLAASVPYVGPRRATLIVRRFGMQTEQVLDERPDRLIEVDGIGPETAKHIAEGWKTGRLERNVAKFLVSIKQSVSWARPILRDLGPDAVHLIQKNPYCLVRVRGIQFKTADEFAQPLGWTEDSPERTEALLQYVLSEASGAEGHVYLTERELLSKAQVLQPKLELLQASLEQMVKQESRSMFRVQYTAVSGSSYLWYLPHLFRAEKFLAERIRTLLTAPLQLPVKGVDLEFVIQQSEAALGLMLTPEQREAVLIAFTTPISILTGGPGTGKSATIRIIVDVCKRLQVSLAMCAPTGRAAKHLSDVTGGEAFTMHRLFGYKADDDLWLHNQENPLSARMTIIDECSMIDVELARHAFDGIPPGRPLMLLGDKDQLPSVGPGRIFEDLINCGHIPTTRLTHIFRQAAKSLIIRNAHRVLEGKELQFPGAPEDDCFRVDLRTERVIDDKDHREKTREDYAKLRELLVHLCRKSIPNRLQLDPIRDIQVLTPMKQGECGVHDLNAVLQDALNPQPGTGLPTHCTVEVSIGSKRFRLQDRVIQTRNNYKFNVYNGDIGFVEGIDEQEKTLDVRFYDQVVKLPFNVVRDELQLAYCMSIHKSQGSEFKAVVVVLLARHHIMLARHLLFTAMTRPKQLLVFMALPWVIRKAVKNVKIQQRNSLLVPRIDKLLTQPASQVA